MSASRTVSVLPGPRTGTVSIPASKSRAHRLLICAALSRENSVLICRGLSADIEATCRCLRGMGAGIDVQGDRIHVRPLVLTEDEIGGPERELPCGESGSTLRFLLPVVGALGLSAVFRMEGRLPFRPMDPLTEELRVHGMRIRQEGALLHCEGKLRPGAYRIPGNISSQYISGLLFALPLLEGDSTLTVTESLESADYVAMTEDALRQSGFRAVREGAVWRVPGNQRGCLSGTLPVESDWSSAAFFLSLGALSPAGVTVRGMNFASVQGDRAVLEVLRRFGASVREDGDAVSVSRGSLKGIRLDASGIPDLVPVLAVVAAAAEGETVIEHAGRLRLKESDRLETTAAMLRALGADVRETPDGLRVSGHTGRLRGGEVSSFGDHRIAMSAAVAASLCESSVLVSGAECTDKSFPGFWETLDQVHVMEVCR